MEEKEQVGGIPQIKPTEAEPDVVPAAPKEESILVPKVEIPAAVPTATPKTNFLKSLPKISFAGKGRKIAIGVGIFLLAFIVLIVIPGLSVYGKSKALYKQTQALAASAKGQNLQAMKAEIGKTKTSLTSLRSSFTFIYWTKFIPFIGSYVADAEHGLKAYGYGLDAAEITLTTVEPYADILGITTDLGADGAKTAQERIDFVVKAIPTIIPKIDEILAKANQAKAEIDAVNPNRYPVKFAGREVREPMKKAIDMLNEGVGLVSQSKPLLEAAPYLLGLDSPRQYLLLFQNDKELRPTGGFMTAYAIMKVEEAKFEPVASDDIYNLDAKYRPRIPAPEPISKYIKGPYILSKNLRLRDMNWSPDFTESMQLFTKEAESVGVKGIDGVIAVDTQLLVNLLDAIGPIGVSGFGNFSTQNEPKCNCPQVIYELESFADTEGPIVWDPVSGKIVFAPPNIDNRKKIIGPLMNSILANSLGQPKEKLPKLAEAAFKSLLEKHVLFYLYDEKAQAGVTSFGVAGTIKEYDGDYLAINDANLGGRKSNLYATQEVEQEIVVAKDGSVEKTVTITYKNPEKHDGWLNSVLPNWVRIYVPKGSTLVAAEGLEDKADPYEELDKTVFAGFFQLRPEGVSRVTFKYKLPFKVTKDYKLLIQKQPGTDKPLYHLKLGKTQEEFFLKTDKEFRLRI
ncbi:hypothetical protein A2V61_01215 [Candidatus Woesebacteria bacterium RBG_19FT_COMBO_47_8]|uniref:DUF4012 domain-containing protein n=1 Tax=Candidatus Woesebacteria bacterium RBG_13_46_13 TaxID=1802479 RepID=A0A1F7X4W6_9BACT|nr:MAG: hypothetical protein A2Y68_00025 [Candidatus Woesebacteria bacterium RBG_13_46_13]OGM18172.1 MAG: hypothetical protein A2V61_01215 [Candidatus Woesebacteria bacterium RBG_19FT_COMBO_47_8]HJX58954.1 DUF4012 domain-containing protein [Patescibacteria group bacterium]